MAIAGVKPVHKVKTNYVHPSIGVMLTTNDIAAGEYYDCELVRKILVKFANSKNAMRRDMTAEHIVDEFMEGGEE